MKVRNARINRIKTLMTPSALAGELPLTGQGESDMKAFRSSVTRVLNGEDRRYLAIVGPCSVHDPSALLDFAGRLKKISEEVQETILVVLRVYFEKPRTVGGWKGLINDPYLDNSYEIDSGLRMARKVLLDVLDVGLPAATEFLDTTLGQYFSELVSFGAIGARTVESQIHRELASGLSMPVGFKNGTSGDVQVAVDAIRSARLPHWFPTVTESGAPAVMESSGNPDCHLILRGGSVSGPNFDLDALQAAAALLAKHQLSSGIIVDCSHGNSEKQYLRQLRVLETLGETASLTQAFLRGVMIESHLIAGRQDITKPEDLAYGQSITDACLSIEDARTGLLRLADALST